MEVGATLYSTLKQNLHATEYKLSVAFGRLVIRRGLGGARERVPRHGRSPVIRKWPLHVEWEIHGPWSSADVVADIWQVDHASADHVAVAVALLRLRELNVHGG